MEMIRNIRTSLNKRRLRRPEYEFLFEKDDSGEFVAFDCETSGLDPSKADLLSIGAVRVRGGRILTSQRLELIVRPRSKVDPDAIKIHHLREIDVKDGLPVAHALDRFLKFIGPRPLVGYYLEFDVAMIEKYLKPWLGITLPNRRHEVSSMYYDWFQRKHQARVRREMGKVDLRFDTIMQELALPKLPAHDAVNDAVSAAMMYLALKTRETSDKG